jgi:iron-sulfur cluster assembly accessory protein
MSDFITEPVALTPAALKRIAFVLSDEPQGAMLRIGVSGGGCSGFQYNFAIDTIKNEDDIILGDADGRVVIDTTSLPFLAGSTIDFIDDLTGQMFRINNPHATASCGCGTSFGV